MADARVARLRAVPLFAGCSDEELRFILTRVEEMDFPAGRVLCKKGESGGDFFVILEGQAEVEASAGKRMLGPGEFFGEIALLDGGPRTATVTAETDLVVEVVAQRDFYSLLTNAPTVTRKILSHLGARLRLADAQLAGR